MGSLKTTKLPPAAVLVPPRACHEEGSQGELHPREVVLIRHDVSIINLLLGLAWAGEFSSQQIQRIWLPHRSRKTVQRLMAGLERMGLVARRLLMEERRVSRTSPQCGLANRVGALWSLTAAGLRAIAGEPTFPPEYLPPRAPQLAPHDWMSSEILSLIIERGRAERMPLSSIFIQREVRIDPGLSRPVADAIVIVRQAIPARGADLQPGDTAWLEEGYVVPFSRDDYLPESERRRRWALENDRGSEALNVLAAKAVAYRTANTPEWVALNGPFPMPLIVTTTRGRKERITREWSAAWPEGTWMITSDVGMREDRWTLYHQGTFRERTLYGQELPPSEAGH